MGVLESFTSPSPVVEEYNKGKGASDATVTPAATPAKPKEVKPPTPEEPKPEKIVEQQPSTGGGTQAALKAIGDLEKQRSEMMPPKLNMPEKPKSVRDDIQLWGALAIAFAGIASARTRTPMTTALNAAAAAMNGMREGQKERADQAYKEWEENTRIALETANYEQRAYQNIMDNISRRETLAMDAGGKLDEAEYRKAELQFKTMSAAMGDMEMQQMWDKGMAEGGRPRAVELVAGLQKQRKDVADKLKASEKSVVEGKLLEDNLAALKANPEYQKKSPMDQMEAQAEVYHKFGSAKAASTFATGDEDKIQQLMNEPSVMADEDAIANYQLKRPTGWLARGDHWVAVQRRLIADHPEYSDANYNAVQKINSDMAAGPGGGQVAGLTMLMGHMQTLERLADSLPNDADSQAVNRVIISAARQFGDPSVTNYETAAHAVSQEFNKALLNAGIGAQEDREKSAQPVVDSQTKQQLKENIETMKELVKSKVVAKINQMAVFVKPEKFFSPQLRKFYGLVTSDEAKPPADATPPAEAGATPEATKVSTSPDSNAAKVPVSEAIGQQQAPAGWTDMHPLKNGGWIYRLEGKDGWFDKDGKPFK